MTCKRIKLTRIPNEMYIKRSRRCHFHPQTINYLPNYCTFHTVLFIIIHTLKWLIYQKEEILKYANIEANDNYILLWHWSAPQLDKDFQNKTEEGFIVRLGANLLDWNYIKIKSFLNNLWCNICGKKFECRSQLKPQLC